MMSDGAPAVRVILLLSSLLFQPQEFGLAPLICGAAPRNPRRSRANLRRKAEGERRKDDRRPTVSPFPLYNFAFSGAIAMEAEKINAITRRLADVEGRTMELRRYL